MVACGGRGYRRKYKKWRTSVRVSSSSSRSGEGGGEGKSSGGAELYSEEWWFWSKAGRKAWKKCKKAGKDSERWKKHKCGRRTKPSKGSKWWWWTKAGRKTWKQCKEKGKGSAFWKDNDCGAGRSVDPL